MDSPTSNPDGMSWLSHTISAAFGALVSLFAMFKAWASVKANADIGAALAPRVQSLETERAVLAERWRQHTSMLDEVRADVKRILERVDP